MYAVLDPDPEIRGGGVGGRPSIPKIFFGPSGLNLGLKICGEGGGEPSRPLHHWYVCP